MANAFKKHKWAVRLFAAIEILMGGITFIAVILNVIQGKSLKPLAVLIFVLTTATISTGLGLGILRYNLTSYRLLLYFSNLIIFSKLLIFAKIITFSGALETTLPSSLKNVISILYHSAVIFYFTRKPIKEIFGERRNLIFSLPSFLRR